MQPAGLHCRGRCQPFVAAPQRHGRGAARARQMHATCSAAGRPDGRPAPVAAPEGRWQAALQSALAKGGQRLGAAALAAALALGSGAAPAGAVSEEQLLYLEAWRAVDRAYVDKTFNGQTWFKVRETALKKIELNTREQTYDAIRDMLASLDDPFTRFLEPARFSALQRGTAGAVTGVGLEVGFDSDKSSTSNLVIAPAPGGPADRGGVRPGDIVEEIGGTSTRGLSLYEVGDLLQGPEGSQVTLRVRTGKGKARDIELTRQKIAFNPVQFALCKDVAPAAGGKSIGYIRVASFNKQTADNVRAALKALQADGAERLVLDIRNNGGGLFAASVEIARMLLDSGDIVLVADAQGVRDIVSAQGFALDPATPLVVVVNRGTASASEVLAGALKDNGRARVLGERTFGKGLIQTVVPLSDGSGVAVTVAKYQTPRGIDINKIGITPDVELDPSPDALPAVPDGFCALVASPKAPPLF